MARHSVDIKGFKALLKAKRVTQKRFSQGIGMSESALTKSLKGMRALKVEEGATIARSLGRPLAEIFSMFGQDVYETWARSIPVLGFVGASEEVILYDEFSDLIGIDELMLPFTGYSGVVLRVKGDSMSPRYLDGDVIAYSERLAPEQCTGQEVVAKGVDGRLVLKWLQRSAGALMLVSHNPQVPPIVGVELEWVARIDFHIPRR